MEFNVLRQETLEALDNVLNILSMLSEIAEPFIHLFSIQITEMQLTCFWIQWNLTILRS